MKTITLLPVLAAGVLALGNQANAGIDINSAGTGGVGDNGIIEFVGTGDNFSFLNSLNGFGFVANGSIGGAAGLGTISGTYHIGAITTSGPLQTAPVTSVGAGPLQIDIDDNGTAAGGNHLIGTVGWIDIFTLGTAGGLNAGGSVNLTSITYAGANPDLLALRNGFNNNGIATIQFGFVPAQSLTALTTDGSVQRSTYTGDLQAAVPDGGATLILLGSGLIGLLAFRRRIAS